MADKTTKESGSTVAAKSRTASAAPAETAQEENTSPADPTLEAALASEALGGEETETAAAPPDGGEKTAAEVDASEKDSPPAEAAAAEKEAGSEAAPEAEDAFLKELTGTPGDADDATGETPVDAANAEGDLPPVQRRINQLTARNHKLQEELEAERGRREALESQVSYAQHGVAEPKLAALTEQIGAAEQEATVAGQLMRQARKDPEGVVRLLGKRLPEQVDPDNPDDVRDWLADYRSRQLERATTLKADMAQQRQAAQQVEAQRAQRWNGEALNRFPWLKVAADPRTRQVQALMKLPPQELAARAGLLVAAAVERLVPRPAAKPRPATVKPGGSGAAVVTSAPSKASARDARAQAALKRLAENPSDDASAMEFLEAAVGE